MYILIAVLAFGILIAVHELGHFLAAKASGVLVNEFSIGMGPAIWKKQKGETQYSIRILPIGGFCAMEGESEESDDPRAFLNQSLPKKLIILAAGPFMNFIAGFLVVLLLWQSGSYYTTTRIAGFMDGFPLSGEAGLMENDQIIKIDGHHIFSNSDMSMFLSRGNGKDFDLVIKRGSEKIKLDDFPMTLREYTDENGNAVYKYGLYFAADKLDFASRMKNALYDTIYFSRSVVISLLDLVRGSVGVDQLSGVVGIVDVINDVGQNSETVKIALQNIAYLIAFIAVNLALMNLLPIPALDGGHIFSILITTVIEKIRGKKLDPKYEAYIHGAGMILLLGLMAFVMYNDIVRLLHG